MGVFVAIVSRVLNHDTTLSVGDATRRPVIETAEAMNYGPRRRRPRLVAGGSMKRIAHRHFRTPDSEFRDPYFVAMRLVIEIRCAALQIEVTKLHRSQDSAIPQIPRERRAYGIRDQCKSPLFNLIRLSRGWLCPTPLRPYQPSQ